MQPEEQGLGGTRTAGFEVHPEDQGVFDPAPSTLKVTLKVTLNPETSWSISPEVLKHTRRTSRKLQGEAALLPRIP
jgi:hypothetical protein